MAEEGVKFRYAITFGRMTPDFTKVMLKERSKALDQYKKEAEKYGVKVLFWGHPWGVSEGLVIVYDFGESIENYERFILAMRGKQPFTQARTNLVLVELG